MLPTSLLDASGFLIYIYEGERMSWIIVSVCGLLLIQSPQQRERVEHFRALSTAQFDAIPALPEPYIMIVAEKECWWCVWERRSRGPAEHLQLGTLLRVLKEHGDFLWVETRQHRTGWVLRHCLIPPKHPEASFRLVFALGDSLGKGVITSPVRVGSDSGGNIYVLEMDGLGKSRLMKFSREGDFLRFLPIPPTTAKRALLAVDGQCHSFVRSQNGIVRLDSTGRTTLEMTDSLVNPAALDISDDGSVYVLDGSGRLPRRQSTPEQVWVRRYGADGTHRFSFRLESFTRPTDIVVHQEKIYVLGRKKRQRARMRTAADRISIYSAEGQVIGYLEKGESCSFLRESKTIGDEKMTGILTVDSTKGYIKFSLKQWVLESTDVVDVYDLEGKPLYEINSSNFARGIDLSNPEHLKYTSWHGLGCNWTNIAVDREGRVCILIEIDRENCWQFRAVEFDARGRFTRELPYEYESCFYRGSPRGRTVGASGRDLESYLEDEFLLVSHGWVFKVRGDSIGRPLKDPAVDCFSNPTAAAIDRKENIWVSDIKLNLVKKFDRNGSLLCCIGGKGEAEGLFNGVGDLAVDRDENLWVVDASNYRIQKFNPEGDFILSFRPGGLSPGEAGISFDVRTTADGMVEVMQGSAMTVFNSDGEPVEEYKIEDRRMWRLWVAFDEEGNFWKLHNEYGDFLGGPPIPTIRVFSPKGEVMDELTHENFGDQIRIISDLEFGPDGSLWIADPGTYQVKKFVLENW